MGNEELIEQYKTAENLEEKRQILLDLFEKNSGFVNRQCARYSGYIEADDARQECFIAICDAAETYDSGNGAKFITWFRYWCKLRIVRAIENTGRTIRVPVHELAQIRKYKKFVREYETINGKAPDEYTICAVLRILAQELQEIKQAERLLNISCIDAPITEDGATVAEIVADPGADPERMQEKLEREELAAVLWAAVARLPEEQAHIVRAVYKDGQRIARIAEEQGKSCGVIADRKRRALKNLYSDVELKRCARDEYIYSRSIRGGFGFWKNKGMSATEYEALRMAGVEMY